MTVERERLKRKWEADLQKRNTLFLEISVIHEEAILKKKMKKAGNQCRMKSREALIFNVQQWPIEIEEENEK